MQPQKFHHYSSYPSTPEQVPAESKRRKNKWVCGLTTERPLSLRLPAKGHQIKQIESHLESDARPAAGWPAHSGQDYKANTQDHQDRRFTGHLDRYYDEVIAAIHDAQSILIFGPGEAKGRA